MIFEKHRCVVIMRGRHAGMKAVIADVLEDTKQVILVGINKVPRPITDDMSNAAKKRRSSMRIFIKKINMTHIIATRYTYKIDMDRFDLKSGIQEPGMKKKLKEQISELLKKEYAADPSKWIFEKLKF
ncbi:60S ribosomal protein L27 [Astathelohania contejeani]|uniref:60S ribosomal protein L27 n=1 Tax=Astathelohania contejeani TaxID=164912 RepID=A0ABQ7I332_9MICR|nr:60S ribosomal protein L27 [Thelohania contejeani]